MLKNAYMQSKNMAQINYSNTEFMWPTKYWKYTNSERNITSGDNSRSDSQIEMVYFIISSFLVKQQV